MSLIVQTPGGNPQELRGSLLLDLVSVVLSAGTYNDFAPDGYRNLSRLVINSTGAVTLTGLAGGIDGRIVTLYVVGSGTLTLSNNSGSSAQANRFQQVQDVSTLNSGQVISLLYDSTFGGWIPFQYVPAGGGGVTQVTGSFTAEFGGFSPTFTATVAYLIVGDLVTLTFPLATGSSSASTFTLTNTGRPAAINATTVKVLPMPGLTDAGTRLADTQLRINAGTAAWDFIASGGTGTWTSSGSKGFGTFATKSVTYSRL
jgi:hypothetical protein